MTGCCEGMEAHEEQQSWHCERPREAIGKGKASVAIEGQDYRDHAEKLRLGAKKRAQDRLLVKVQSSCSSRLKHFGDASIMMY